MATISILNTPGLTLYAIIFQGTDAWNDTTGAMEAFAGANWADYALALAETDGLYTANVPAALPDSTTGYTVIYFEQLGVGPVQAVDTQLDSELLHWHNGTELGLGAVYTGTVSVPGYVTHTLEIEDAVASPLNQVIILLRASDDETTDIVRTGLTDAAGQEEFSLQESQTYYAWVYLDGYVLSAVNPTDFTVPVGGGGTTTITLTAVEGVHDYNHYKPAAVLDVVKTGFRTGRGGAKQDKIIKAAIHDAWKDLWSANLWRHRQIHATLTTTEAQGYTLMPDDYAGWEVVPYTGLHDTTSVTETIRYIRPRVWDDKVVEMAYTGEGRPKFFTITRKLVEVDGEDVYRWVALWLPTPDDEYEYEGILYWRDVPDIDWESTKPLTPDRKFDTLLVLRAMMFAVTRGLEWPGPQDKLLSERGWERLIEVAQAEYGGEPADIYNDPARDPHTDDGPLGPSPRFGESDPGVVY